MSTKSGKSADLVNVGKKPNEAVYDGAAMAGLFGDEDIAPAGKTAPKDKLVDPLSLFAAGVKTAGEKPAASGGAESAF